MREIAVGIRIDLNEGISFFGIDEVNALINFGAKVTLLEGGGAVMRKLGKDEEHPHWTLSGCDLKVILDDAEVENSPALQEHNRIYQEGCDLIKPYMHIVGRKHRPAESDEARAELERGIAQLVDALKINPANSSAHWIIGKAHQALGDSEAAWQAFRKSYLLNQGNADIAREYMFECLNLGKMSQGIAAARHAVKLKPEDAGLLANLALACLLGGKLDEAVQAIENSLALSPDDEITQNLNQAIRDVQSGRKPQPTSMEELETM